MLQLYIVFPEQCHRLSSGLTKLTEAADQIKVMNEKLEVQQVAVKQKSEACDALLVDISAKTEQVSSIEDVYKMYIETVLMYMYMY